MAADEPLVGGYLATIRENATGREVEFRDIWPYGKEGLEFMWSEGNYSCDCNRKIFFDGDGYQESVECGEGKYSVRVVSAAGEEIFSDMVADGG